MGVEAELAQLSPEKDMLLTIGVFDGVHLGHRYLISQLTGEARQKDLSSGVLTFSQHPREVLQPESRLPFLTDLTTRVNLLKNEGVEAVILLSFTPELAQLSAREFINLLKKHLRMRGMVIGPDSTLGQNQEANTDTFPALGQEMDFSISMISPVIINGEVVSSTAVRKALTDGDVKKVASFIGRAFSLHGPVITGTGRGRELGFPTANLKIDPKQALPADGVYATWTYIDNMVYKSMTNIGHRPTFDGDERTIEVFIPDYRGNLYGNDLRIDIIERLRDEKRFKNAGELTKQIAEDIKQGGAILNSLGSRN